MLLETVYLTVCYYPADFFWGGREMKNAKKLLKAFILENFSTSEKIFKYSQM